VRKGRKTPTCNRQAKLATYCFSEDEHMLIRDIINDRFNLELYMRYSKSHSQYIICFSMNGFRKFIDLVRPYILTLPPSMLYKFNMKYRCTINPKWPELYNFTSAQNIFE